MRKSRSFVIGDAMYGRCAASGLRDLIVYLPMIGRHMLKKRSSAHDWDLHVLYRVFSLLAGKYYFMEEYRLHHEWAAGYSARDRLRLLMLRIARMTLTRRPATEYGVYVFELAQNSPPGLEHTLYRSIYPTTQPQRNDALFCHASNRTPRAGIRRQRPRCRRRTSASKGQQQPIPAQSNALTNTSIDRTRP
jgi:hypothetical protein